MWALMEELASNRACAHQIRNEDSRCDIRVVDAKVHDISQGIIDQLPFDLVDQQFANM